MTYRSVLKSCATSRTRRWNGCFRISGSTDFWYFLISLSAKVPGRHLCRFLTLAPPSYDLRAALVANCLLGVLPPVLFLAVCFVRAMSCYRAVVILILDDVTARVGNIVGQHRTDRNACDSTKLHAYRNCMHVASSTERCNVNRRRD